MTSKNVILVFKSFLYYIRSNVKSQIETAGDMCYYKSNKDECRARAAKNDSGRAHTG